MSSFLMDGAQVRLRDWQPDNLPVYREWLRPYQQWHLWDGPYFPPPPPPPSDAEADAAVERLEHHITTDDWPDTRTRVVIADSVTDQRIGITVFDVGTRGCGVGTEALGLWAGYLFGGTDIRRLDYSTWSGNTAMCRVGQKLGWKEEARFRDARVVRGEVFDSVVYGITRDEWHRARTMTVGQEL
ncbi:GNAT family N-acetyltransferase [Arthrobacter roseus]|uniref:GNAT family N-acetyltransferase n=1 Tax=Arthrobacter roseus TaxID=136274 RepID=UPI001963D124|nr:GNAT family protein [Arthrobacter roseus]MBM7847736.1 putative hydrolase of HD superfamily [Arthrobacter roseus]